MDLSNIEVPEGYKLIVKFKKIKPRIIVKDEKHKELVKKVNKTYYEKNKERLKEMAKEKYKNDIEYKNKTIENAKKRNESLKANKNQNIIITKNSKYESLDEDFID
jgi:hypothetical protein